MLKALECTSLVNKSAELKLPTTQCCNGVFLRTLLLDTKAEWEKKKLREGEFAKYVSRPCLKTLF